MKNLQCLLLHHLCRYLLEVGWGVFHHLVTSVLYRHYQLLVFIILWMSSQGLLLDYSMLHCYLQYGQSAVLRIVSSLSRSGTTSK